MDVIHGVIGHIADMVIVLGYLYLSVIDCALYCGSAFPFPNIVIAIRIKLKAM